MHDQLYCKGTEKIGIHPPCNSQILMCEQAQPEEHGPAEFAESQLEKPHALRSVSDVQGDEPDSKCQECSSTAIPRSCHALTGFKKAKDLQTNIN